MLSLLSDMVFHLKTLPALLKYNHTINQEQKKTLWSLFRDRVQLPYGYKAKEETAYFLLRSPQKSLELISQQLLVPISQQFFLVIH